MSETRLTELETKICHLEDTVESLNQTILEQQKTLDTLETAMMILAKRVDTGAQGGADIGPANDPPPHY